MGKKISRVLPTERDYPVRPYALINHTHEFYANTVADLTARDAIEGDRRYEGVIYYVESDQITYQLRGGSENTDWVVMVSALGATSHLDLTNIGTNTHDQIDTHIADATLHFTQASISIEESQISDLQSYALASHDHDTAYLGITATATAANALSTTGASVNVSGAAPPVVGQILTATSATAATWQNATAAGIGDIVQTGTPVNTHVGYFTADKNLSGDAGFTWITASARLNVIGASPVIRLQDDDNVAATMVAALEFYDSAALAGQLFFTSGAVTLQNLGGDIVFDTNGTATVSVTGNGDLNIGGYITDFAGTPTDGQLLVWVTANSRAEFATAPTGIVPDGTPVDNQVVVFTSATNADGSALFTWDGSILTVDAFVLNNSNDVFTIGDGVETVPGIEINGSATASPFINLQQSAVTQSIFRYNNTLSRTELSSLDDEIALRPGNVDSLTVTQTMATFVNDVTVTGTLIAGDPGSEAAGITIAGISFDANIKSSNLNTNESELIIHKHSTTTAATLVASRSNTNDDTHAIVADTQSLFNIAAVGWDGVDYQWGSGIQFVVDGTPASNDIPGSLVFQVDGLTNKMWLRSSGDLELLGGNFDVQGNVTLTGTVDGRDVDADGTTQDSHIADTTIHFTQAAISIPLTQGANDVTATAAEVNLLDLAGLTAGWVLSADTATTATWKAPTGGIAGSITNDQVAFGAATADEIEGDDGLKFNSSFHILTIGDGTIANSARIAVNGDATSSPNLRFQQAGVSKATFSFSDVADNLQITCVPGDIIFEPSETLALTLTSALATFAGAVTVQGAFTSLGIDDNATAEMLQLADGVIQLSASGTDFAILMKGNTDKLQISGGASAATGAAIQLRGSTDVNASDFEIWADGNVWMHWDESLGALEIKTGVGAKTAQLNLNTARSEFVGDVAFSEAIGSNRFVISADVTSAILNYTNNADIIIQSEGTEAMRIASSTLAATFAGDVHVDGARLSIGSTAPLDTHLSTLETIEIGIQTVLYGANNTGGSHFMRGAYHNGTNWVKTVTGEEVSALSFLGTGNIKLRTATSGTAGDTVSWIDSFDVDNATGDLTMTGALLTSASTTTRAGFNIAEGVAPTTPVDGDLWITAAGAFNARLNGVTVDVSAGGGGIGGSITDNQIAVGATTADDIEGAASFTWDGTTIGFGDGALTANSLSLSGPGPQIIFDENDAALDQGTWLFSHAGETFVWKVARDSLFANYTFMQVERSGTGTGVQVDTIDFTTETDVTFNTPDATFTGDVSVAGELAIEAYSENADSYTVTVGTKTLDTSLATYFYAGSAMTAVALTFAFSNPAATGRVTSIMVEMNNATAATITWPTGVDWPGGTEPTWTAGIDVAAFWTRDGGTTWHGSAATLDSQ